MCMCVQYAVRDDGTLIHKGTDGCQTIKAVFDDPLSGNHCKLLLPVSSHETYATDGTVGLIMSVEDYAKFLF